MASSRERGVTVLTGSSGVKCADTLPAAPGASERAIKGRTRQPSSGGAQARARGAWQGSPRSAALLDAAIKPSLFTPCRSLAGWAWVLAHAARSLGWKRGGLLRCVSCGRRGRRDGGGLEWAWYRCAR